VFALALNSMLALVIALGLTAALVVYGLMAWERIVRRTRERLPGTT